MRAAVLLLAVLLAGCASAIDVGGAAWQKPEATIQQVTLDEVACARSAESRGATPDLILGGLLDVGRLAVEESQRVGAYRGCMLRRGYRPTGA